MRRKERKLDIRAFFKEADAELRDLKGPFWILVIMYMLTMAFTLAVVIHKALEGDFVAILLVICIVILSIMLCDLLGMRRQRRKQKEIIEKNNKRLEELLADRGLGPAAEHGDNHYEGHFVDY